MHDVGRSGSSEPSGLRPFGAEPAAQSQAKPLVPNAECVTCGAPLTIPADVLASEEEGFNCAGCYFVGAPK